MLLKAGANMEVRDEDGLTVLLWAVKEGDPFRRSRSTQAQKLQVLNTVFACACVCVCVGVYVFASGSVVLE